MHAFRIFCRVFPEANCDIRRMCDLVRLSTGSANTGSDMIDTRSASNWPKRLPSNPAISPDDGFVVPTCCMNSATTVADQRIVPLAAKLASRIDAVINPDEIDRPDLAQDPLPRRTLFPANQPVHGKLRVLAIRFDGRIVRPNGCSNSLEYQPFF